VRAAQVTPDIEQHGRVPARHHGVVAPRPLTRAETADLARSFQALLEVIERDEMTASKTTVYRLEGAATALQHALGTQTGPPS
jgi:hypothetical protein